MGRPKSVCPSYSLHKPTNQARVRVDGRDIYLGPFNSPESRQRYAEILTQLAAGRPVSVPGGLRGVPAGDPGVTVNELVAAFLQHADGHYGRYVLGRETLSHASRDHGRTFTVKGQALVDWDLFPSKPMVVEREDGSLWMLVPITRGIGERFFTDGGVTWSLLRRPTVTHTPSRYFIGRLQSGNLLLGKHLGIDEGPVSGGKANQRRELTAWILKDDGTALSGGLVLDDRVDCS